MTWVVLLTCVAAVAAYGMLVFVAWWVQDYLVFPTRGTPGRTPGDPPYGWPYEYVILPANGETTHGWYVPVSGARGTVLFSHGNAGTIGDRLESMSDFRALGLNVLIYDYGGYGYSAGRPSEERCHADALAMWRYLTDVRGESPDRIVLFGRSLGGAVAARLATEVTPAAVILESTFTSAANLGQESFPFLPVKWLMRNRFDTESRVAALRAPVLFVHSPEDRTVPWAHGRRLFDLARDPKEFLVIHGDHNDGCYDSRDSYRAGLDAFLTRYLGAAAPARPAGT